LETWYSALFFSIYQASFSGSKKTKNSHFGSQAAIAFALGPIALRPCFSAGLPLSTESRVIPLFAYTF